MAREYIIKYYKDGILQIKKFRNRDDGLRYIRKLYFETGIPVWSSWKTST